MLYPRYRNSFFLLACIADAFFLDFLLEAFADPAMTFFAMCYHFFSFFLGGRKPTF